jgi:hypothetical protein
MNSNDHTGKKPYAAPKLVVYGDIREITRTVPTGKGKNETGTTGDDKTA